MKETTFKVKDGEFYINDRNVEFKALEDYAKETYCRAFNLLMFQGIEIQEKMLENLLNCTRREYSACIIKHTETTKLHSHAVIMFTDSYNQKKSIWRVLKDLKMVSEISKHIEIDKRAQFVDMLNHIRPCNNINNSLIYLVHLSKGAIADNKKPYSLDDVQIAENGNPFLYERLEKAYYKALDVVDDETFSQLDICNYLFDLVECATFTSQFELIDYIRHDNGITQRQRSAVLSNLKNYIFAILEKIKKNT